jgi:Holliday junction resolvase RusA-like endonuclease
MILLQIDGIPVPWAAHQGYGRRAFNPKFKERSFAQWQLKAQYNQQAPLTTPVKIEFTFHMPVPEGTSKVRRLQMLNGRMHHMKRPDTSNLTKFCEDCLKGVVIEDDSQVVEIVSRKIYGEKPKTVIKIEAINV